MRVIFSISAIILLFTSAHYSIGQEKESTFDHIQAIKEAASASTFKDAVLSLCIMGMDGDKKLGINETKMLVPASNMKLISTGTALHELGPEFRFRTDIQYDGEISEGTLHGNLYIKGGADPTLGSKDTIATDLEITFLQWKKFLDDSGIQRIEGSVVGDGSWLDGMSEEQTWMWNDIGTYYGSGVTGLMFYENMQSFIAKPGLAEGDPVDIRPSYPDAPWMEFRYTCTTGKPKTGDRLYMFTSDLAPVAEIRGTLGIDRGTKRVDCSNKFPEYTCAHYFVEWLSRKGITCSEGAADYKLGKDRRKPDDSSRITAGSTFSPSLSRIAYTTNHASNNLYAETLLRTLGKELRSHSSYDSSYVAVNDVLCRLMSGNCTGIRIQDGSGLSRQNLVSAEFFCRFLNAMAGSPNFCCFLESLPRPGGNGTLHYNMSRVSSDIKSRIRVKSGSMNGIRCYSGYIMPSGQCDGWSVKTAPEGTLVFSIMVNNCTAPDWEVRRKLDKIMELAASLN
ncbi:MAG: D-alanyl-D-alanine carboxypeptidase/D-alanyl-D-alanine-endopeptidase [Bacteroidales bacterium]|nr:D-alanyl-D-alanine carboxypeptidase/D-alanyl-D-alanine-endopeptidase [Bacteroidales bacterium]